MRMNGLMSTAASRAWVGVAVIGLALVALVFAVTLIPRLTQGQRVLDAADRAFTDTRVAGTRSGVEVLSRYVDLVDPLLTARGGADREVRSLVRLIRRELGLTSEQARRIVRREAPHTEALMRALPLDGIVREVPQLTSYLATTLTISEDELAALLERSFPRTAQALTALPIVADGWYDVPGIEGLARLSRDKPVRTVPGLRKYLRDDLVALMTRHSDDFRDLSGRGGIGYIPYLLLLTGAALIASGLLQARRAAAGAPPGRRAWALVGGVGLLIVMLVVAAGYFPRFAGAQKLISDFEPVFTQERVTGLATGYGTIHEAVLLGDPLMTRASGVAAETPRLYRLVAQRTGRRPGDVRRALMRRAPQTIALLDALPLTTDAREVPQLVSYLVRALRMPRDRVVALLRRRTPRLAQALLAVPPVTEGWRRVAGGEDMTRFDGRTPVRTMPEFDAYLRQDLLPVLVEEREHFEALAGGGPPVDALAPLLMIVGLVVMGYGGLMMVLVARES